MVENIMYYSLRPKIECIVTYKIYIEIQWILHNNYVSIWRGLLKRKSQFKEKLYN